MADDDTGGKAVARARGGTRVVRLRKQHRELVTKLRRKHSAVCRLREEGTLIARELRERSTRLRQQRYGCDAQLHQLFEEMLASQAMPRTERQQVRLLYQCLQTAGAMSMRALSARGGERSRATPPSVAPTRTVALRPTFLRLASAYHPDTTTDRSEQERNTEIMKELNRAYQDADVARLLELERTLGGDDQSAVPLDAAALEAQVIELRAQLRQLSRQMSELRTGYHGALALEHRRLVAIGEVDPVGVLVDELRQLTGQAQRLLEFLRRYRDGEIDLEALYAGPPAEVEHDWLAEVFATARSAARR